MKIHTLRRMEYNGIYIYVMQFGSVFQYLFSHEGQIYMQHVVARPHMLRWLLWKLRFIKADTPYTKDQLEDFEKLMLSGATLSIDTLNGVVTENPVAIPSNK